MSGASVATRERIAGLDAWRAALMLGGVILHGSTGLPPTALFHAVDLVSQTFRMGAFYGIAGVLTALVLAQRSPDVWIRRRVVQLGIPLTVGMAVIPPFIWLAAVKLGWPTSEPPTPFDWHHLWFLFGLLAYSLAVYGIVRSGIDAVVLARLEAAIAQGRLRATTVLLATSCATAVLFGAAPVVMGATLSTPMMGAFRTLQLVAGYLPMFLFGYLVGRSPALRDLLLARWRMAAVVAAGVGIVYLLWYAILAPMADATTATATSYRVRFLGAAICPPVAFVLILRSALRIARVPDFVQRCSQASYTVYLLHLPVAAAINLSLRPLQVDPYLSYGIAVVGSAVSCFAFHERVARHSALALLLLNGIPAPRPLPPRRA